MLKNHVRAIIEKLSRNVIIKRRLSKDHGGALLYITPEARLSYWYKRLENTDDEIVEVIQELILEGDVVWDIGANVGLFAFLSAFKAGPRGKVLAVEPDTFLAHLIKRSTANLSDQYAVTECFCAAMSNQLGIAKFSIAKRGRASNFLSDFEGRSQSGGKRMTIPTVTLTLDYLLQYFDPPNFIKIDVEGAELAVLEGADEMFKLVRPRIYCEVGAEKQEAVYQFLKSRNYSIFADTALTKELHHCPFNTIAVPIEKGEI